MERVPFNVSEKFQASSSAFCPQASRKFIQSLSGQRYQIPGMVTVNLSSYHISINSAITSLTMMQCHQPFSYRESLTIRDTAHRNGWQRVQTAVGPAVSNFQLPIPKVRGKCRVDIWVVESRFRLTLLVRSLTRPQQNVRIDGVHLESKLLPVSSH